MEVNLSKEMIEKVADVASERIHSLKRAEATIKRSGIPERLKQKQLKEIENEIEEAKEVRSLFWELLEQC